MQSNQPKEKNPQSPTNKNPKATKTPPKTLLEENSKLKGNITGFKGFSITLSMVLYSLLIYISLDLFWSPE